MLGFGSDFMVAAKIDSYRKTPLGVYFYRIQVTDHIRPGILWTVERRFREFLALREVLIGQYPERDIAELPGKSVFALFPSDSFLRERSQSLNNFLRQVLNDVEADPQSVELRRFLGITRPCLSESIRDQEYDSDMSIPPDAIIMILSYLEQAALLAVGRVNRAFHRAALSPGLWRNISVRSRRFETIQRGFMNFLSLPGIAENVERIDLGIQFSTDIGHNLRLSLPGNIHFSRLKSFRFSSLFPQSEGNKSSTADLCQDLLEAIMADSSPLTALSLITELSSERLRTILGITSQGLVKHFQFGILGYSVNISTEDLDCIWGIIESLGNTCEALDLQVYYPSNAPSSYLYPDGHFGERIGDVRAQKKITEFLFSEKCSCSSLRVLRFPFASYSEMLKIDDFRFPQNVTDVDLRIIVDGITNRVNVDRSNRSIIKDILSASSPHVRRLKVSTIGSDEVDMLNTHMTPYHMTQQAVNYEGLLESWIEDWRQKLVNLEALSVEGPFTGITELITALVKRDALESFLSTFPKLRVLRLINCVSAVNEEFVVKLLSLLPFIETLELIGSNEILTDTLLVALSQKLNSRSNMRYLHIPRTRYMSSIGIEAIRRVNISCPQIRAMVSDARVVTGRVPFDTIN